VGTRGQGNNRAFAQWSAVNSVLVTGAGGLIGSRVAEAARKAGYSVTRIFRKPPLPEAPDVFQHDLRFRIVDVPSVKSIIHLAGGYAGAERHALERADLLIARNLIQWGVNHGVKDWIFCQCG